MLMRLGLHRISHHPVGVMLGGVEASVILLELTAAFPTSNLRMSTRIHLSDMKYFAIYGTMLHVITSIAPVATPVEVTTLTYSVGQCTRTKPEGRFAVQCGNAPPHEYSPPGLISRSP